MRDFIKIYRQLHTLMIDKLPNYIDRENKKNDGYVEIPYFTNTCLDEPNLQLPYFRVSFDEAEQAKKDRILQIIRYKFTIEIYIDKMHKKRLIEFIHYCNAITTMIEEDDFEYWKLHQLKSVGDKKLELTVLVEW